MSARNVDIYNPPTGFFLPIFNTCTLGLDALDGRARRFWKLQIPIHLEGLETSFDIYSQHLLSLILHVFPYSQCLFLGRWLMSD